MSMQGFWSAAAVVLWGVRSAEQGGYGWRRARIGSEGRLKTTGA